MKQKIRQTVVQMIQEEQDARLKVSQEQGDHVFS
jgi:hypothetical protein